ncbi:Lnb N-terminal periplasmic domain-containing protein [Asticcacaulis solisilvae]|uniref:Lnb N-terminal periplasmic domain-containing protein n=1 Tax=Asticcacaulis solisilvae TaxID=1217274 RepID=UPI003FD70A63
MLKSLILAATVSGLMVSGTAHATGSASLASDPTWRGLLGYHGKDTHSDVISEGFFLSPQGAHDPQAELDATLVAMAAPAGDNPDQHAQCRFRGRYVWLQSRHALPADIPAVHCEVFEKWRGPKPVTGASIIFASGDLSNPATFYGHMLLRLTTDSASPGDALLENTISNGAYFPPSENGFVYVVRGLSGQYRATYSNMTFFMHLHRYNEKQMRDVWEYKLSLTQDQADLLAAHAFELQGVYNRYYFLRQNCAYRIVDLIDVATGQDLMPDKPWIMPVDTLDGLSRARNGDRPLVASVERLDSRKTRLKTKYVALTSAEKGRVTAYLRTPKAGAEADVAGLDTRSQGRVIETLLDYYSAESFEANTIQPADEAARRDLLVARLRRPAGGADFGNPAPPLKPHEGQKSSMTQFGLMGNSALGTGMDARIRFAYDDFLSITPGALPYSELSFGDIRLESDGRKVTLRALDAVRITTLNLSQTGLPGQGGFAWRLRLAADQERLSCNDCLAGVAEANVGKSAWLGRSLVGYAMVGGRLVGPNAKYGAVQTGVTLGLVHNATQPWRTMAEFAAWQDLSQAGHPLVQARVETRYAVAQDVDVYGELRAEYDGHRTDRQWRTGLALYW